MVVVVTAAELPLTNYAIQTLFLPSSSTTSIITIYLLLKQDALSLLFYTQPPVYSSLKLYLLLCLISTLFPSLTFIMKPIFFPKIAYRRSLFFSSLTLPPPILLDQRQPSISPSTLVSLPLLHPPPFHLSFTHHFKVVLHTVNSSLSL